MKRTCNLFTGILLVFLSLANGQALNAQTMDYDLLWEEEPATIPVKDLLPKSRKAADLSYSVPSDCDSFGFDLTLNNAGGELKIQFELADEPKKKKPYPVWISHDRPAGCRIGDFLFLPLFQSFL